MPRTTPMTTRKNNFKKIARSAGAALMPASPAPISTPTPHFMSIDEVAQCLAVSTKTIRRAIGDKRLSAVRFGRRVLVSQGALQLFMTALISTGSLPPALPTPPVPTKKP